VTVPRRNDDSLGERTESGQAGGEVLAIGFVLLVSMILLGMNVWAVIDAKIRVAGAARYTTRTVVESGPTDLADATGTFGPLFGEHDPNNVATNAVKAALIDKPRLLREVRVRVALSNNANRCSVAVVELQVRVPSFGLPHIGPLRNGFLVTSQHSEIVDPFRSGLEGSSACNP
jgi:hypothetical protein